MRKEMEVYWGSNGGCRGRPLENKAKFRFYSLKLKLIIKDKEHYPTDVSSKATTSLNATEQTLQNSMGKKTFSATKI